MPVPQPLDDFLPTNLGVLRDRWFAIVQTAAAAAAAWEIATLVLNTNAPTYTTLAIVTGLNVHPGQRGKWLVQVVLGAILGVLLANGIAYVPGPDAAQIALGLAAALAIAVLFYSQNWFLINVGAGLVIPLASGSAGHGFAFGVGWQALIAAGVGLAFTQLLFPANAVKLVGENVRQILAGLGATLDDVARNLAGDKQDEDEALERSRTLDDQLMQLDQHVQQARAITHWAPLRRRQRGAVEAYAATAPVLKLAVDEAAALSHLVRRRELTDSLELQTRCGALARALQALSSAAKPAPGGQAPALPAIDGHGDPRLAACTLVALLGDDATSVREALA